MLKSLLSDDVKVDTTIDFRLRSKITTKKTLIFTKKSFSIHFYGLPIKTFFNDLLKTPGTYKSDKPFNITEIDKVHSNYVNCELELYYWMHC